jgi:hypothetical protein
MSFENVKRRGIRYALFRIKAKVVEGKPLPTDEELTAIPLTREEFEGIKAHYKPPKGMHIRDFPDKWDIGIDDIDTMALRLEKYWLFGIQKTKVVRRPTVVITYLDANAGLIEKKELLVDSENNGKSFLLDKGFAERRRVGETKHGKPVYKVFVLYDKIMENAETRITWGD